MHPQAELPFHPASFARANPRRANRHPILRFDRAGRFAPMRGRIRERKEARKAEARARGHEGHRNESWLAPEEWMHRRKQASEAQYSTSVNVHDIEVSAVLWRALVYLRVSSGDENSGSW